MELRREELLKFKWVMEIVDILVSMGTDRYNETKCLFLYREPDEKTRSFYTTLYEYADKRRPLMIEKKSEKGE